jgi:uncharacterized protein (DUF1810 family)
MSATINLDRFKEAYTANYEGALLEIKQGKKQSHWMWYIFPQIQGLGVSHNAKFYSINGIREAEAFLKDPYLGERLIAICIELLKVKSSDARQVMGSPDDVKLKSSMTLFSILKIHAVFDSVLDKFFQGKKDQLTLDIIRNECT